MSAKKILVIGQNGQVSTYLQKRLQGNYVVHVAARGEIDLLNLDEMTASLESIAADIIINPAAFTAVDLAETDQDAAFTINRDAVGVIAEFCARANTPLIHFSTDYVFDGASDTPYTESEPTEPNGVYGASKLAGEQLIVMSKAPALILRTSWVYSNHGKNFYKTMLGLSENRDELSVVADQLGSPTYAGSIADVCATLAEKILEEPGLATQHAGVYHFSCGGETSWCEFAKAIFLANDKQMTVNAISTSQYPTPAQRPAYSVLNNAKLEQVFGLSLPHWQEALQSCVNDSR